MSYNFFVVLFFAGFLVSFDINIKNINFILFSLLYCQVTNYHFSFEVFFFVVVEKRLKNTQECATLLKSIAIK